MGRPSDDEYFITSRTEHVSQGDIFPDIEFELPDEEELAFFGFGMLMTYTSGMMKQPPGTRGYRHPYRLIAPIFSLRLLEGARLSPSEIEKIRTADPYTQFMYLPSHLPDFDESVVLPYRPRLMLQEDLPEPLAQLQEPAARQLQIKLFGTFLGGKPENPERDLHPDMSDHWNDY